MNRDWRICVWPIGLLLTCGIAPLEAETNHTIRKGETVYSVARKYQITPEAIISANRIEDHTNISVGAQLVIPQYHLVAKQETYYSIAKRYRITVAQLLALNSRSTSDILGVGERLVVPVEGAALPSAASASPSVVSGDSAPQGGGAAAAPISTRLASTSSDNFWPHSGKRGNIKGKFPAVTFEAQAGDAVRAVYDGRVIYVGNNPHFGRVVFIQAPTGHIYIYGGHDSVEVQVGALVSVGSVVGRVGRPGAHQEHPRIYFSVWRANRFVDPQLAPRG